MSQPKTFKAWRCLPYRDREFYETQANGLQVHVTASERREVELKFEPVAMLRKKLPKTISVTWVENAEVVLAKSPYNDKGEKVDYYSTFFRNMSWAHTTKAQREKAISSRRARSFYNDVSYAIAKLPKHRWSPWREHGSSTLWHFYNKFYRLPHHNPNSKHEIIIPMEQELLDLMDLERLAKKLDK